MPFAGYVLPLLILVAWCAWWLCCADWKKLWPTLAAGGWAPAVLLVLMAGAVWAQLDPYDLTWPGYYLPALLWHVGAAFLIACLAMFCGWLQDLLGWTPPEFPVHPVATAHGHDHGHH
jgi:peptidoglycan/LPS O-acetylase OafA/YrhL